MDVEFQILGPLDMRIGGVPVAIGGPRQRALLAILLLSANRVVSRDRLIDELLDGAPPANAERMLKPGGLFIFTAAGPGRAPHGQTGDTRFRHADDGLVPGWYRNIEPAELEAVVSTSFAGECKFAQEAQSVFPVACKQ